MAGEELSPGAVGRPARFLRRRRRKPTLSQIDRRSSQLWLVALVVVASVVVAIAVQTLGRRFLPESLRFEDLPSWIVVVLVAGLAIAFLIFVLEKERDLRRLRDMLIEERVLSAALSNRLREISTLSEVGKAINTTLDTQDVLDLILSSALELLEGTEGSVMLLDDIGRHLEVVVHHGPEHIRSARVKIGEGISGKVAQQRTPLLLQGDEMPKAFEGSGNPGRHIYSSMCVPLLRQDEVLGVLNLNETAGKRQFGESDLSALGLFAEHAAIALGNARLFAKERETVQRLEELDQMKSDFLAIVSHELKTPLTAIIGAAKTLARKSSTMKPEQHEAFMRMIERQGENLLRMVEDVLTAAKIEAGIPRLRRELVDLKELAVLLAEDLLHTTLGEGRQIEVRSEPEQPQTWGDLRAIHQILNNLLENALKYSEGPITITMKELPREALIEVADEGQGIPEDKLQKIFDRFQQVDTSSTRTVGGVGLGLYIVKSLVDALNGTIGVTSKVGEGTTFSIHLPKRARDVEAAEAEATG